jgi:hypothetical protein
LNARVDKLSRYTFICACYVESCCAVICVAMLPIGSALGNIATQTAGLHITNNV